jgi:hypothetical protein
MQSFLPNETGQKKSSKSPRFLNIINSNLVSVFTLIHEQHGCKRLKGMFQDILYGADANSSLVSKVCKACRRRKVKCDPAATDNWPCSECTRLRIHCVPPSINHDDRDFASNTQACEPQEVWPKSRESGDDEYHQWHDSHKNIPPIYTQQAPYPDPGGVFYSGPSCPSHMGYDVQTADGFISQHLHEQNVLPSPPLQQQHSSQPDSPETYEQGQYGQQNWADLLGALKINEAGTGRFLEHIL